MIVHTVLFLSLIVFAFLDFALWSRILYLTRDTMEPGNVTACRFYQTFRFSWTITDIINIGILSLQTFMSNKFSAPAETYRSAFLLVYQAN